MLMHMPLPAGLGLSTVTPDLDFETYSEAGFVWDDAEQKWKAPPDTPPSKGKGLGVVGAANYAMHPTCEILSLFYDLKDGRGRRPWRPGMPVPADLHAHVVAGGLLEAWNVAFERWIWEEVCVKRLGWPPVHPRQWRCAMSKARAHALPGKLEKAGEVMQLQVQKDKEGKRLLDRFSVPRNPTKTDPRRRARLIWDDADYRRELAHFPAENAAVRKILVGDHEDSLKLARYNEIDIVSEAEASGRTPDLLPNELEYWLDDQAINHRGIAIDVPLMHACVSIIKQCSAKYDAEFEALTGIPGASKLEQLKGWLHARGVHLDSVDSDAVEAALARPKLRTVIAGSRSVASLDTVAAAIDACGWDVSTVISGGAPGADTLGEQWAAANGVPVERMPAQWITPDGYDQTAGHQRNAEMAQACQALIAVWDGMSPGTHDMIQRALALGRQVFVSTPTGCTRYGGLPPEARRALELRAAVGSASVKKVFAMRNLLAPTGRLHDLYNFHGARTGRPTGQDVQPTNLPKAGPRVLRCMCGHHHAPARVACPWCGLPVPPGKKHVEWNPKAAEDAIYAISTHSLGLVEHIFDDAMGAVAGALRGLFTAAPGHDLVSSDFTAIEGVVIAGLAGEQWRLDVFAGHGKIYEMSAAKILGITFEEMMAHAGYHDLSKPEWWKEKQTGQHHPGRQKPGKIAELALGFGGWITAWRQFGGVGDDDKIKSDILAWREASPNIVHLWGGQRLNWQPCMFGLEGAAVSAVLQPGQEFPVMRKNGTPTGISYVMHEDVLYCRMPSGTFITYHRPRLEQSKESWRGLSLSFEGWNTNPKSGPLGWVRMNTYSGKLAENVTQKAARDIQMNAIRNCERDGAYPIVMHTYDELVAEVPKGRGSVEELEARMTDVPPWAKGWPIKAAGGWRDGRYQKA